MYGLYMNVTAWYGDVITYTFRAVGEIEEVCDGDGDASLCIALPPPPIDVLWSCCVLGVCIVGI